MMNLSESNIKYRHGGNLVSVPPSSGRSGWCSYVVNWRQGSGRLVGGLSLGGRGLQFTAGPTHDHALPLLTQATNY